MIIEPSRQFRIGLEHPEYGVNAQLQDLELYDDHEKPRDVKRILDWTRDNEAVTGNPGTDLPAIIIPKPVQFEMEGEVTTSKRDTQSLGQRLAMALLVEAAAVDSSQAAVEAGYIITAAIKAIREWLSNDRALDRGGDSGVHGIQLRDAVSIFWSTEVVRLPEADNIAVAGGVFVDIIVRDISP